MGLLLAIGLLTIKVNTVRAQGAFEQVTGKTFDGALPDKFYLEGNAIPTQKRNAAMLKTPAGARLIMALLDTSGYSSRIQEKYKGMLITEGSIFLGDLNVGVGSYGFGLETPEPTSDADAKFFLYDQAGEKVGECAAKKDAQIERPRPLQVVLGKEGPAKLYLGRYWIELK